MGFNQRRVPENNLFREPIIIPYMPQLPYRNGQNVSRSSVGTAKAADDKEGTGVFEQILDYLEAVNKPPDINVNYGETPPVNYTPLYVGLAVFTLIVISAFYFKNK